MTTLAVALAPGCTPAPSVVVPTASAAKPAQLTAPGPAEITEIKLEFRRGGPPLPFDFARNIHLRRPSSGTTGAREYDRLAKWLVDHRFFDLQDRYSGPEPSDCPAVLMTVAYGDQKKRVLNYCGQGDEPTWEFETMIRGVASALDQMRRGNQRDQTALDPNPELGHR